MDGDGSIEGLVKWLRSETSKCAYCGFCESVCPTIVFGPHRGYGPRGRVNVARIALDEESVTGEGASSLYSCLLCAACTQACPAGIDIPEVVRVARFLIHTGKLKGIKRTSVEVKYIGGR